MIIDKKILGLAIWLGLVFGMVPEGALAQPQATPTPSALFGDFSFPLPGITEKSIDKFVGSTSTPTITYINSVIPIVIGLIVLVAAVMIVLGGYLYMTAGGSGQKVETAKTFIVSALGGIVLALTAWVILNTISPQFASELKDPKEVQQQPAP